MQYPHHERMHAYFMYSLCRGGWRSRALEVFHKLRISMIDELGLEPCAKVQRLHRHILDASEDSVDEVLSSHHASYLIGLFTPDVRVGGIPRN
jgi:DNA-binding SARP family transcriptional activator